VGEHRDRVLAPERRALRPAWAEIDLAAVRHNTRLLRRLVSPAQVCAVVKADAYGHGAVEASRAALEGGAAWLAVATVEEGISLRDAGISAPVLLLSEPPPDAMRETVEKRLTPTIYSRSGVELAELASASSGRRLSVHVKVDTGMHRVGVDPDELPAVLSGVAESSHLELGALWTHFAVADGTSEEDRSFTEGQLRRFSDLRDEAARLGFSAPMLHAANSSAAIAVPGSRLDMVRCGISVFGVLPSPAMGDIFSEALRAAGHPGDADSEGTSELRPALSFRAEVSYVRRLEAGERPSYGRLRDLPVDSVVATVPVGYADGVPRRFFTHGGTVLVGGRHRQLAGAVTMDQIMIDCGPDSEVCVGDEVVLIGEQGGERLSAWDWAGVLGTISYEVLTGIGPRVPRMFVDSDYTGPVSEERPR